MAEAETKEAHTDIGNLLQSKSITPNLYTKRSRRLKSHGNTRSSPMTKKKLVDFLSNSSKRNDFKRRNASYKATKSLSNPSLVSCQNQNNQPGAPGADENENFEKAQQTTEKIKRRRKRKRAYNKVEVDDAMRLQRRTRYLLIKMKIDQNLLDAYSTEGWKGQSREKIKPEKELQKAKKQILKCKLGLRDALRQLESLSSEGCIDESVIGPDGSVHHDNIHCAKCKLRDAYPDNDIILCDGTCNCAFHQMCIDPPLLTENIPPGDQGWYCKYCICKTEIIDAMNAHLGTSYSNNSNWQDIFKIEATLPETGDTLLNQEDWPSEDSGDDDYDPDKIEKHENSCSNSKGSLECESSNDDGDDVSSSYSLNDDKALDDESLELMRNTGLESTSNDFINVGSGSECELVSGRRQRRAVNYRKLYDEMFGKDALANEQVSEDEDWGPTNNKRREKESDAASTLMALCETEGKTVNDAAETSNVDANLSSNETKRSFFRIPPEAVEKLRVVFATNELPSRAVKEDISKQLGLDPEKVNKWFKNARYLSLRTKKAGEENPTQNEGPSISKESESEPAKIETNDEITQHTMPTNVDNLPIDRRTKKFRRRSNPPLLPTIDTTHQQQDTPDLHISASTSKVEDDTSFKTLQENAKNEINESDNEQAEAAEAQMEKLCYLKTKLEKLQQIVQLRTPNRKAKTTTTTTSNENENTIFVPVVHLREKP